MQKFVNHRTRDMNPSRAKRYVSWPLTLALIQCIRPKPRQRPLFTMGGSSEAEMAVPTMALNPDRLHIIDKQCETMSTRELS